MGDNLVAARQFSGLCQANISALISNHGSDSRDAITALKDIQTGARELRARSIFLAAQTAIEEFNGVYSASQRAGALLTLNKLVRQYTDGLDEIAPVVTEDISGPSAEGVANWKQVRETFVSLRRFAKTDAENAAFSSLAALGPFVPGEPVGIQSESFELLMPAITDESLRQAREAEKSVSVSYATDNILMDETVAERVQEALIEVCQGLVRSSVEVPSQRQNQGLSGAAHIAITAKRKGATFDVLVSCEGPVPVTSILTGPKMSALRTLGASFNLSAHENLIRVDVTGLPVSIAEDTVQVYDQALGMRA